MMRGMKGMKGMRMDEGDEKVIAIESRLVKNAKDLVVYKKSYSLSLDIHRLTLEFPKIEQYALADQLRRSSKSVCANIAEGFGKQSYSSAEFGRFLAIAEGSVIETQTWLQYASDLGYINSTIYERWDMEYYSIKAMLYKLRRN